MTRVVGIRRESATPGAMEALMTTHRSRPDHRRKIFAGQH